MALSCCCSPPASASVAAGAALVGAMWQQVPHAILYGWMAALVLHQSLRVYHYASYMRATGEAQGDRRWQQRYLFAVTIAGVIWGSAGVLMYVPGSLPHQAMLMLILFGIATVSMASIAAYAPAFYILIPLILLPALLRMLLDPGPAHIYIAILGIIVFAVVLSFGHTVNRIIAESLEKRFENLDLVESLTRQTEIAERARLIDRGDPHPFPRRCCAGTPAHLKPGGLMNTVQMLFGIACAAAATGHAADRDALFAQAMQHCETR